MKKLILILIIIFNLLGCVESVKITEAKIKIPYEINLDTIKNNIITYSKLDIKNIGNTNLIIKDIKSSCDCTVIDKWDSIIKIGESSTINLEILPTKSGLFQKNVVIRSNIKDEFSSISIVGYVIE